MLTVRAQDIPEKVQIIGRLGQPLGTLVTISGQWISPGLRVKDPSLVFRVSLVNGKEIKGIDDFHGLQIEPIFPRHKGRKPTPTESWV